MLHVTRRADSILDTRYGRNGMESMRRRDMARAYALATVAGTVERRGMAAGR